MKTGKEILNEVISELEDITPYNLSKELGYERTQALYDVLNEKTKKISGDLANRITQRYPKFNITYLLTGEGSLLKEDNGEIHPVERINVETRPRIPLNAAAGSISVALDGVTNEDSEQLPFVSAFSNYNYTILVKGDSMEPEFMSGDELACLQLTNGKARFIQWGRYHVLDTAQGVVVKRIYDNGEYILCKSENKELYPDFQILKEDIYNIGLVIGMLRRY